MKIANSVGSVFRSFFILALAFGYEISLSSAGPKQVKLPSDKRSASKAVELNIHLEKTLTLIDESNSLALTIKNNSKEVLLIFVTYPARDYEFDVRNEEGQSIRLTETGDILVNNPSIFMRGHLELEPGETIEHKVQINKIYDMSVPGKYSVRVKRKVYDQKGNEYSEVISNRVEVQVVG